MKTQIKITGQINGNRIILNNLDVSDKPRQELPFNDYLISELNMAEAKALLRSAKRLLGGAYITRNGKCLNYDSSRAEIITNFLN